MLCYQSFLGLGKSGKCIFYSTFTNVFLPFSYVSKVKEFFLKVFTPTVNNTAKNTSESRSYIDLVDVNIILAATSDVASTSAENEEAA